MAGQGMDVNKIIYTGLKFFGQKIMLESTGDKEVDEAMKSVFKDDYRKTAPLNMTRRDVSLVLGWYYGKNETAD